MLFKHVIPNVGPLLGTKSNVTIGCCVTISGFKYTNASARNV